MYIYIYIYIYTNVYTLYADAHKDTQTYTHHPINVVNRMFSNCP